MTALKLYTGVARVGVQNAQIATSHENCLLRGVEVLLDRVVQKAVGLGVYDISGCGRI